jgi:hypothetical protein
VTNKVNYCVLVGGKYVKGSGNIEVDATARTSTFTDQSAQLSTAFLL